MTIAYSAVPQPGRADDAVSILEVTDRDGNVLEENRPQPTEAIRADTAFVMTNLLRRRRPARHGRVARQRSTGRSAARPARPTTTPTRGSSASIRTSRSACGSASTQKRPIGQGQTGVGGRAADLDRRHDALDRAPAQARQGASPSSTAPGNIVFATTETGADAKPSSPARSRERRFGSDRSPRRRHRTILASALLVVAQASLRRVRRQSSSAWRSQRPDAFSIR